MENKENKIDNLSQKAAKGVAWGLIGNVTVSAISFISTAILARMLEPEDFGLFGMAILVTGVMQLFGNFGLGAALIHKKEIDDEYLSTAFWINIIVGAGLALTLIIISPLVAMFFNQPEIKWILILLSSDFLISAVSSIHSTILYREIRMKRLALIEISCRVLRVITILGCAYFGLRFWSIVIGVIVERVFKSIGFVISIKWKPTMRFCSKKFKELFSFGRNVYGSGFLNYFGQNVDFLVTAKVLGADILGYYQFAYNLPYLVKSYVRDAIPTVAFSVFSKVQDDKPRVVRGLLKMTKFVSVVVFPLMAGLFFNAHDFMIVVYGSKWLPAVEPMRILCLGAAISSVFTPVGSVLNSQGRPDIGLKFSLVKLLLTVLLIVIGAKLYGTIGVAFGMLISEMLGFILAFIVLKLISGKFIKFIYSTIPAFFSSVLMLFVLLGFEKMVLFQFENSLFRLMSCLFVGAFTYSMVIYFCFTSDLKELIDFIKKIVKK